MPVRVTQSFTQREMASYAPFPNALDNYLAKLVVYSNEPLQTETMKKVVAVVYKYCNYANLGQANPLEDLQFCRKHQINFDVLAGSKGENLMFRF